MCIPVFAVFAQNPPAPSDPDGQVNGYDYVDLGLPSGTLWAMQNIGSENPTEYGDYFAWGELEPKDEYTWESYEYVGEYYDLPGVGSFFSTEYLGDDIAGTEFDAATFNWGKPWRLPRAEEIVELRRLCWWKWTTENGIKGMRIYGPNTHSIFFRRMASHGLQLTSLDSFITTKDSMELIGEASRQNQKSILR